MITRLLRTVRRVGRLELVLMAGLAACTNSGVGDTDWALVPPPSTELCGFQPDEPPVQDPFGAVGLDWSSFPHSGELPVDLQMDEADSPVGSPQRLLLGASTTTPSARLGRVVDHPWCTPGVAVAVEWPRPFSLAPADQTSADLAVEGRARLVISVDAPSEWILFVDGRVDPDATDWLARMVQARDEYGPAVAVSVSVLGGPALERSFGMSSVLEHDGGLVLERGTWETP